MFGGAVLWATRMIPVSVLSVMARHDVTDHGYGCRGRNPLRMRRRHRTPIQSEGKRKDQGKQQLSHLGVHGESRSKSLVHVQSMGRC
jgi:hypothetical protein